jgi:hypothetical protein
MAWPSRAPRSLGTCHRGRERARTAASCTRPGRPYGSVSGTAGRPPGPAAIPPHLPSCLRDRNSDYTPQAHPAPQAHPVPDDLSWSLESDGLFDLRPPRLVLVREPDLLRVERADQPLAFGARLVELREEDRQVTGHDD